MQAKKLIEVAMPIKEISAESVRDKSIRHGHISTLHLWWARRPLPVSRAVVFASLVPDPLDANCPQIYRDLVDLVVGKEFNLGDPYKPYDDIPYTSIVDKMEDNLRNRLMMFIGKFSDLFVKNEKIGKATDPKDLLSNNSLIKWDNKNNKSILNKARKLIYAFHNCDKFKTAKELSDSFDHLIFEIDKYETELTLIRDRHINSVEVEEVQEKYNNAISVFLEGMPKVFDPFAGGGAIPLEISRLGCNSYGNDINPVAHIVQKGSLEYPQKYGKRIIYSKAEFISLYGRKLWDNHPQQNKIIENGEDVAAVIENRLSFDVKFYTSLLIDKVEEEIGNFYPSDFNGKKPIAYYWAYNGTCSNPTCRAKVPLLKQFYLVNTPKKKIYLKPIIENKNISFELKTGISNDETWIQRKNLKCPICQNITDIKELKRQFNSDKPDKTLIAVIEDGANSKNYRLPTEKEKSIVHSLPNNIPKPLEKMPKGNSRDLHCTGWGVECWGDMFTERQLLLMNTLVSKVNDIYNEIDSLNTDYKNALVTYLAIFVDRIAASNTSFGRWATNRETLQSPFSRQAIPFMFDFPESNPFSSSTGSALNQQEWILRYIESESDFPFITSLKNATSGDESQFLSKELDVVVTDPPYYDAIAYADLSDFFYVWLKKMLIDVYPLNFSVPQTPKTEECTALKHHHQDDMDVAKKHFENKLLQIFSAIENQTKDLVSIMFAHQSTEAWTTLCNSILDSRMNITGSWAIDTEMGARMIAIDTAALQSSVTVSARPFDKIKYGDYKNVKSAVEKNVAIKVDELYQLGFRGADLLTACFGQAVSEFGKYEKVEKADGSDVKVSELLEMARESAFNALLKGFDGDDFTKFYIGWLQLYGFSTNEHNAALRIVQIGLSISIQDLYREHILILNQSQSTLANFIERNNLSRHLGERDNSFLIDKVHRAMQLFKGPSRTSLLEYISKYASIPESSFWRVVTSLCEVLPNETDDYIQAIGLLTNKDSLIKESANLNQKINQQGQLEF